MPFEHRKIGEILVEMGTLAPAEVRLVVDQQRESGQRFGETANLPWPSICAPAPAPAPRES